jgi:SagB-type dehydrogenase family enzyme
VASGSTGETARRFHDRTAHSPASVRQSTHTLDWDNKPFPFKVYTDLPAVELPRSFPPIDTDVLVTLRPSARRSDTPPTLEILTALLFHSAGVTKKKTYPGGGEVLFRAAASTGALYQTELYVAAGVVTGLSAGLYHFCPGDFTLRRLREGDVRGALATAAGDDAIARRPATIVVSAIYWRNTWKYQARGYRHLFWDSGTLLANLLAAGNALGQAPRLYAGFVDADVNALLGLDVTREAALELVAVGHEEAPAVGEMHHPVVEIHHPTLPLSAEEVDYPALRDVHRASALASAEAVRGWRNRGRPPGLAPGAPAGGIQKLPPVRERAGRSLSDTVHRRGSTRRFSHAPLSAVELATALAAATAPFDADFPSGLVDLYLIVNAVDDIPAGAYVYDGGDHALISLRRGEFRRESAYLCLEQPLGGDAAAVIYFLAPLDAVLSVYGDRGYRLVNLEAGLAGGRAYLAAYGQGFGASGLTFYDRAVVEFFAPHAAGKDAIFVTALGRSASADRVDVPLQSLRGRR